ncbi:hypothetical protein LSH36_442g01046 [Paralvinella palmiformis]|uniref:Cytosol aminopeptidase domain-containing protein n=1 Tax=Paralvinella palmiformis TaxID=53620 RepID=A0AAD9JBE9_9ANNE|nr:hypothetical protein LSH36_442g01046 [Paralvinella palmiformis]
MTNVSLTFSASLTPSDPKEHPVLIVGQQHNLNKLSYDVIKVKLEPRVSKDIFSVGIASLHPSPTDSCPLWMTYATVAALPVKCSRHNTPSRSHSLTKVIRSCLSGGDEYIVIVCEKGDVFSSACATARSFPIFTRKSSVAKSRRHVSIEFLLVGNGSDQPLTDEDIQCINDTAFAIRLAARITDTPCIEMHTEQFIREIEIVAEKLGIEPCIIKGEELKARGFGGLYHVGKAATHPAALVVLSHKPQNSTRDIAWVGKGIVYDTGGLSIKGKTTMPGMKRDCGGAAAVLGAFYVAVKQGFRDNLHAVFCLAENSVGPESLRPDDIITLYSGRTVEVNNTDAEGRLVLGDGVSYAQKELKAVIIVDLATLTGAQGLATGRYHGALLTNDDEAEVACVHAGKLSGDLVHPLIYCPEIHFSEFASALADMKNSSADRSNAEVSCAGLFIGAQLGFDFPGTWIHIDMAYPVYSGERATGYGVGLLLALFGSDSEAPFFQSLDSANMIDGFGDQESATKKIRLA